MGAQLPFFVQAGHAALAGWLAILLIKAGNVETNPGPTTTRKQVWICDICHRQIQVRTQISIRCNRIEHWVRRNPPSTIYRYLALSSTQIIHTHNTHIHNITTPSQTLAQAANPLSHNTTHTTATKTQTHIPLSPCSSRIGKVLTQSCHPRIPNTSHPAKHIHMSHTPPKPLATLISSTSHALAKTPKPRVPHIYALTVTTPPPDPTPEFPSPSHPNSLAANTHATQTTVHASQSPQQPHPQQRVPRQPHRQTKDYHRTTNITQAHRPSSKSEIILQVNINGLKNKLEELKLLIHDTHADIITIQKTKLTSKVKTPKVHNFTTVRNDRLHKA